VSGNNRKANLLLQGSKVWKLDDFHCKVCLKTIEYKSNLIRHEKLHEEDRKQIQKGTLDSKVEFLKRLDKFFKITYMSYNKENQFKLITLYLEINHGNNQILKNNYLTFQNSILSNFQNSNVIFCKVCGDSFASVDEKDLHVKTCELDIQYNAKNMHLLFI
jgi:hypothetical protein